ncbi:uncharacterized protein LOC107039313 [Diachasma alloeum]|uniref:uncharacterized protein LOC107039313 n=1 Tax=Diachasma alloeum TaxID=454923 RepID=UPI000738223F|nr:uncharacterized protein LOC107039313 [Diachasma alloeum]
MLLGKQRDVNYSKLSKTKFSIVADISHWRSCCLLVKYFDKDQKGIVSKFWDLIAIPDSGNITPENVENFFHKIHSSFTKRKIPDDNLIGFASDGGHIMMYGPNSLASFFERHFPGITLSRCICQSLQLCVNEACKELSDSLEDAIRTIMSFEDVKLKIFPHTELPKMHPSQTFWLSVPPIVERIIEQWDYLQSYFHEKKSEPPRRPAERIDEILQNPRYKLFFLFLSWILPQFEQTNEYFRSKIVIIADVHREMTQTYKSLLSYYMKANYLDSVELKDIDPQNENEFLPNSEMFLGTDFLEYLRAAVELQNLSLDRFYKNCRNFLIKACNEMRKRYDFGVSTMVHLKVLHPKNALSKSMYNRPSTLQRLLSTLPRICAKQLYETVDTEWNQLRSYVDYEHLDQVPIYAFWGRLLEHKSRDQYPFHNLATTALEILSLPLSNYDSEKTFVKINQVKINTRN